MNIMEQPASTQSNLMVDAKTLSQAGACTRGFSCLEDGICSRCRVFASVNDTLLVQCMDGDSCAFRSVKNGRQTCECPVRKKLFSKYGN